MEDLCQITNINEDELRIMYGLTEKPRIKLKLVVNN